jgi:hypothetical protein
MDTQKRFILRIGLLVLLIASLSGLMAVLFGEPTPQARNARTITQLQQYVTALELVRLEKGTYPVTEGFVCVGDYTDDLCWNERGRGVEENHVFNDMLDTYVPLLSSGLYVEDTKDPNEGREGYVYRSRQNGRGYEIQYLLIGKDKPCGFGQELTIDIVTSKDTTNTLCTIIR